jgi:hypothetical protein
MGMLGLWENVFYIWEVKMIKSDSEVTRNNDGERSASNRLPDWLLRQPDDSRPEPSNGKPPTGPAS